MRENMLEKKRFSIVYTDTSGHFRNHVMKSLQCRFTRNLLPCEYVFPLPYALCSISLGCDMIGIVMGSQSDWPTMKHAADTLGALEVPFETRIVSAHRTPDLLFEYATEARERGLRCIIAGAGGAAHLPGMLAAKTAVPVLGVPVRSSTLNGVDSLLSIVQMPKGIPVATFAIGKAGAINAALFGAAMMAGVDPALATRLDRWRSRQTAAVLEQPDPQRQEHA